MFWVVNIQAQRILEMLNLMLKINNKIYKSCAGFYQVFLPRGQCGYQLTIIQTTQGRSYNCIQLPWASNLFIVPMDIELGPRVKVSF